MSQKKTALILIDIQNDYFPGGKMELAGSFEASLRSREVLDFYRKMEMPVIHVRHVSSRPGATFFLPGTSGAEIHENVSPVAGETVIEKNYPNSFRETCLQDVLKAGEISGLVIVGMMTHMCVDATTRAAFDLGYQCTLVHDACATKQLAFKDTAVPAEHVHASFMAALGAVYADIVSAEELVSESL